MSKTLYNPAENQHGLFPRCHPPIKQQNISISSFQHVFDYIDLYHYHPIHPLPDRVPVWFMFVFRIMVTLVTFEAACIQGSDTRSTTVSWSPQITTPKFAWNLDDWMPPTVTKPNCLSKSLQKKSVEAQSRKYYGVWVPFYISETFADSQTPYLSQANRFMSNKNHHRNYLPIYNIYISCCFSSVNLCHTKKINNHTFNLIYNIWQPFSHILPDFFRNIGFANEWDMPRQLASSHTSKESCGVMVGSEIQLRFSNIHMISLLSNKFICRIMAEIKIL